MNFPARTSLAWRLYAIGVVQLLVVALAAVLIGVVMVRLPKRWDLTALTARLEPLSSRPPELRAELDALLRDEKLRISIYDDARRPIASNVDPPLRPPAFWEHAPPVSPPPGPGRPRFEIYGGFDLDGRSGLIVARFERMKPSPVPPLLTLLSGFIVVGLGAFLTARWIGRPLQQLSRAASALGAGDLQARTGLRRGDELGQVGRAFDDMAERIQRLLAADKELLANVAHELRTPLARIRVALEIAGEGDAEAARASLAEIAVDLGELETLVDDVLTATRMELRDGKASAPGFALRLELCAPRAVAERAAERFRSVHPGRALTLAVADDLPAIEVDPALFRRVIGNLLENAHKYTHDATRAIELRLAHEGDAVVFEVADSGIGIAAVDVPRIFEPFFRSEPSRSRGSGGVGLGLTLVKRIVDAHGARVEVESTPGTGTRVRVLIGSRHRPESRAGTPRSS